jgi:hypothetical protein
MLNNILLENYYARKILIERKILMLLELTMGKGIKKLE